jgi:hypothetical protein
MAILGKVDVTRLISASLDAEALVHLCHDILFVRGHMAIRRTDGPGDGGRDIHSVTPKQKRHLTQAKFHSDAGLCCSSAELSELPMAMVKLDYSKGLFVTNARVSPQAKREFLDNYPKLNLEFLDGEALAEEVLSSSLLAAMWFDGASVADVNVSMVFPVLVRSHEGDKPIPLDDRDPARALECLRQRHPKLSFHFRTATSTTEPFGNYRAPEPLTIEEGVMGRLATTEITVTGKLLLANMPHVSESVAKAVLHWLDNFRSSFTVKVGEPYAVPLAGEQGGARILTGIRGYSLVGTPRGCGEELAWFGVGSSSPWSAESDARVSESDWIRLYDASLDCAMS